MIKPHRELLKVLLKGKDSKGNTPFHLACQLGRLGGFTREFVSLYTDKELTLTNELDQTPFHIAAKYGNPDMLECLLERDKVAKYAKFKMPMKHCVDSSIMFFFDLIN